MGIDLSRDVLDGVEVKLSSIRWSGLISCPFTLTTISLLYFLMIYISLDLDCIYFVYDWPSFPYSTEL